MRITATDFKNKLGEYMQEIYKEPVIIEKQGRPTAVFMTYDLFQKLSELEDCYWGMKAEEAAKSGFLGPKESERRLKKMAKRAGIEIDDEKETL